MISILVGPASTPLAEGDWTPIFYGSITAGTTAYNIQRGKYYRIGKLVFIQGYIAVNSRTGTGSCRIGGLPFNFSANYDAPTFAMDDNYVNYGVYEHTQPNGISGTKTMCLEGSQSGGGWNQRTMDMFPDGCGFKFTGSYITEDDMPA